MARITTEDRARIAEAVRAEEARSSGEIVCVVAGEASDYKEVSLAWAAAIALLIPPIAVVFGWQPQTLWGGAAGWQETNASIAVQVGRALTVYIFLQTALFLLASVITFIPAVRRFLTPKGLKRHHVERLARQQFAAAGVANAHAPTGVLILVAMVDHQVMVLADTGIHEKAGQETWERAAEAVRAGMKRDDAVGGILDAIRICGDALAQHFPHEGEDPNRLTDAPVVI